MSIERPLKLLCVEDSPDDVELIRLAMIRHGMSFRLEAVSEEAPFRAALERDPDLVLCDYSLPMFSPLRALELIEESRPGLPLIVVTRAIGEEAAVAVLRAGARDYHLKERLNLLGPAIERVMRERRLEAERRRAQMAVADAYRRLSRVSARIVDAQERERALIARELHDELGQTMTGIVLHLHAVRRARLPDGAAASVDTALALAQDAVEQVRRMSFMLRPPQLDLLGLSAAVRSTVERQLGAAGVQGGVEVFGAEPREAAPCWIAAFRIVQEAVTNALRHSRASRVVVRLRFVAGGRLVVTVGDDGQGFDVPGVLAGGVRDENFGLAGMVERAEMAGGHLRIRAKRALGTVVRAVFEPSRI
ncbi:histidine kinase [Burkholderiaceae bacterium FT117]|uniref:ATP-binding response regulator n=1 Tax=Zeimonas sediminis TaxID=2944268 RepID=UPI0023430A2B|nr:histidine kinase [Zeimonas sediminis]MCM5572026.1 histidine kinase [Zeimonas sediminis]